METSFEGKNAEVGRARSLSLQHTGKFLLGKVCSSVAESVHVAHEDHLDTVLVGAGAAHHGKDLGHARGSHGHQGVANLDNPVFSGEPAQSWPVIGQLWDIAKVF